MKKSLEDKIEEKRLELVDSIISYGVSSPEVLKISEELDEIINTYQSASSEN